MPKMLKASKITSSKTQTRKAHDITDDQHLEAMRAAAGMLVGLIPALDGITADMLEVRDFNLLITALGTKGALPENTATFLRTKIEKFMAAPTDKKLVEEFANARKEMSQSPRLTEVKLVLDAYLVNMGNQLVINLKGMVTGKER